METISLNGAWELFGFPQKGNHWERIQHLDEHTPVAARVPGVAQLDWLGTTPEEIYFGQNISQLRKYEGWDWCYRKRFRARAAANGERIFLCLDGVDCCANIYLNGERWDDCGNALIPYEEDITDELAEGENELAIYIKSPIAAVRHENYGPMLGAHAVGMESLYVRRPPSSYGWDILCRAVTAGLWRGVRLEYRPAARFTQSYIYTHLLRETQAEMRLFFEFEAELPDYENLSMRIEGRCGEASFDITRPLYWFNAGTVNFNIENPKLWWPAGYGEQNLYEVTITLLKDGAPVCDKRDRFGVRTVELRRTDITTPENPGEFVFLVNGVKIFCKGSNWVPLDALHREDAARYEPALEMFRDTRCNMLRCWGGNVYEDNLFYELCDTYGILVWQDFSMACALYPQDSQFRYAIEEEAEAIIRKLRQHPCLALWSGDNECDSHWRGKGLDPNDNALTRKVLPEAVARCDPARPYLPSSPYESPEVIKKGLLDCMPESHLWGPRDYFKSDFYTGAKCHFVSEIGYHGCPNRSSIEKFIPQDKLWPWQDEVNPDWLLHCSCPTGKPGGPYSGRNHLMNNQAAQFFGAFPQNLDDLVLLSQITQAEAKKFFIESARAGRWYKTGVLWWNMLDGWPQFSDAVVDWYFGKKLAYHYIKRSQAHLCLLLAEPQGWQLRLLACNDTLQARQG
ncbi:MAG: glycoside hydrolase family 2, partial [Firmicutes bacterium]|nr:glycoside hydrolase family 2 [Bacillota bacterium]